MSETPKWYVIHTYSGYENKVASSIMKAVENRKLYDLITDVTIPVETAHEVKTVTVKKRDENGKIMKDADGNPIEVQEQKSVEVERKLFPGYVLVKMILTDESWYLVRNTRGCTGFVSPNSNKPLPLTDEEAAKWGAAAHEAQIELSYKVGDSVRVCGGPLADYIGVVDEIDMGQNRVHITVPVFGRETPVELELSQVEAVED